MKKNGFDLVVHKRNHKGHINRIEPYKLVVENGQKKYERPPGSGYFYAEDGSLISQPKASVQKSVVQEDKKALNQKEKDAILEDILKEVKENGSNKN